MSPDYEYYYKPALCAAEKRLKQLRKTTSSQWKLVHNDDISVYSNIEAPSNYKVTKQLNAAIDLEVLYTVLSTVNLRTQWCQLFKDIIVTETPQPNISIIQASIQHQQSVLWAERTEKKVNHVTYIANSFSTPSCTTNEDFFMACEVESRFDMAHVTLYCQFEQVTPEALSLFVNNLLSIRLFGWINYYDHDIEITQTNITKDTLQLEYQFKKENKEQYSKSQPVNIHSARHHTNATTSMTTITQRRFQSGSWDQESITKPICQHYLDKNASNSHLASTSSSLSYQHKGYMEEEQETITPEKEVRIQVMDHPNLTLLLPDNPEESNRFAQMCLNYYCRKEKGYIIQLIHPIQFMQYFTENNKMPYFRVHLTIGKSKDQKCYVNNNNWPVRPSLLLKMEHEKQGEGISTTDDEEGEEDNEDDDDQDEDIFVDGMESFQPQINAQNETPALNPSQSTPASSTTPVTPITTANITATTTTSTSTTIITAPPETSDSKSEKTEIHPEENKHEITIPDSDPLALRQIYPRFVEYIQTPPQSILQHPAQENGNISISRIDVPNHPLGALITNTIWNDCSIWDVKSVIENPGAKKVWDPLFEESELVCSSSSTSSIWHTKRKGTWFLKAYDYVCFHSEYKTEHSIDLCSTSCPSNDTYHHKNLPQATSSYSRAKVDVDGTRLKKIDHQTVSFESVLMIQLPSSWLSLPPTSRSFVPQCSAIQQAKKYLETHGAPPSIEDIKCGLLIDTKYDHDSKSWRCEYTRHDTYTTSASEATRIHVRLDKRRWASTQNNQYSVVIDPPPSRFTAMEKNSDRFGIWLTIEHDESFIIPLCGKILVLIKPDDMFVESTDKPISINGISIPVEPPVEHVAVEEKHAFSSSYSENFLLDDLAEKKNVTLDKMWVMDHASTVFSFLKHTDEQFGWTVMSDNVKTGTRICKKSGTKNSNSNNNNNKNSSNSSNSNNNNINNNNGVNSNINSKKKEEENENTVLKVPEPFMIYKATKVIENFSLDEVVSVVTDIDQIRRAYDDTIDNIELYRQVEPGCRIVRQSVKAIFPFKSRDLYTCTCLAQESSSLAMQPTKRTFYIESSLPNYPPVPDDNKKPLGHLFISGWILEPVDPYTTTTNHPIPSTRVCYVAALDLGQSVPSYISNLVANNWLPKKIQAVEGFLKSKNPPPYLVQPSSPLVFANNTLGSETEDGFELKETQTTYDRNNHVYRVVNQWSVSEPSTKKKKPNSNANNGGSGSSTSNNNTKSEEGTIPFITHRRPSHGAVFTETIYRRGSLPSGILKKRIGPLSEKTPVSASKTVTCLECRIDLRSYPKGYEMTCHLWDMSEFKRDMTGKLTVLVTEPPLSNLINNSDGKKHYKHTVLITADITLSDAILELEFELMPAGEEAIQRRSTRLTVSGVLADEEDNNDWDGIMLMNSKELSLGKDTLLDYVQEYDIDREDDTRPSILDSEAFMEEPMPLDNQSKRDGDGDDKEGENDDDDDDENETNSGGIQYIGGGVVATAIGNVSAGVNNLGARMMIPFRAASQTFLSKDESPKEETSVLNHPINNNQSDTEEGEEEETEENGGNRSNNNSNICGSGGGGDGGESKDVRDSAVTLHEVRVLRKSSETMKKGMLLMFICCGLSVVLALLLLQFMLERYYTSFTVSSTLSSLDESVEKGVVHRLIQIPWFGGWNIQLIAIRSSINK